MQPRIATVLTFALLGSLPAPAASDQLNQALARIFKSDAFDVKSFGPARWIRGGASFTTLEASVSIPTARDIIEYDTASGKRTVLVPAEQLKPTGADKPLKIEDYRWSEDFKRLLIFTESRRTWRTNTRGDYWLLDRTTGALKKLGGDAPASSLRFAKFSPDGSRVAYVRGSNLYVEDVATNAIRALTSDTSDTIVNGSSDWVYEEELNLRDGFRWSPDGRTIAFWQFDESGVEQYTLINDTESLYPKITKIPYPKAGTKNSAVRVGAVSVDGGPVRWIEIPGDPRENYLFRMDWVNGQNLAIGQLNRLQNTATIYLGDPTTGAAKVVFTDKDEAWVDVPEGDGVARSTESFDWLKGHKSFIWLSERDGWRRAYLVSLDGGQPVAVTAPGVDVMGVQGIDPQNHWIYYIASPDSSTQRYLYRSSLDRPGSPERLSPAVQRGSHSYHLSPDCHWAFHTFSSFDLPPATDLVSLPDHKSARLLEGNGTVRANVAGLLDPPVEFLQLQISDGVTLDGWVLKPRDFDPARKYPVVVYVYGEPAGTTVVDRWEGETGLFHRALTAEGYLVVSFDNRGTPAPKGRAWRKVIYGSVGVLSATEQTEAVFALAKARPYVDLDRVGVWGWSGGGSNTLNCMFRSPDLFRVGVAVAPVPDQKLYDTIYQERYMGLPDVNAEGYRSGSPINFADGLRGKLLIVHGSGDDNVHFQGTERLVNRLVELGKTFDFMEYPNRSHGIYEGEGTSLHVHSLIARYIEEHLPAGAR
jgi:dipeptidyl-peptidase-4